MVGLSQLEAGEQGVPNWILVAVLLVAFAVEGDLQVGMKDATCQVNSESQNLILPRESGILHKDLSQC